MRVMQQLPDDTTTGGGGLATGDPNWLSNVPGSMPASDPTASNITDPSNSQWAPYPSIAQGTPTASTGNNWLSGVNNFLTTPAGQLAGGAAVGTAGLIAAESAQSNARNLTNAISATARPGLNVSDATYRQIMGGAPAPGPMGGYVRGATGAANELAQTAGTYATGQLTPAQQLQIRQNQAAQNAMIRSQLPRGMGLDSSAAAMMEQQNANNAVMLTQQIEQNNIAIATAALNGATGTYNALFNAALAQAGLGQKATSDAVTQQLKANQQVSTAIQDLLKSIVSGYTTAGGGGGQGTGGGAVAQQGGGGGGGSLMSQAGGLISKGIQGMSANANPPQVDTSWMQNQDPMSSMNVDTFNPLTDNTDQSVPA